MQVSWAVWSTGKMKAGSKRLHASGACSGPAAAEWWVHGGHGHWLLGVVHMHVHVPTAARIGRAGRTLNARCIAPHWRRDHCNPSEGWTRVSSHLHHHCHSRRTPVQAQSCQTTHPWTGGRCWRSALSCLAYRRLPVTVVHIYISSPGPSPHGPPILLSCPCLLLARVYTASPPSLLLLGASLVSGLTLPSSLTPAHTR